MATITGTHVNFVKVPTTANFTDIDPKVDGTIYFIVDAKKIYLDGVMYGFNDSDIDLSPYLKHDGSVTMTWELNMGSHGLSMVDFINNQNGFSSPTGIVLGGTEYAGHGEVSITTVDEEHYQDDSQAEAVFSTNGIDFYSPLGKRANISGLMVYPSSSIEFDELMPSQALSSGTMQSFKGAAGGFAELDETGLVPSSQLPSYVDDVIEVNNFNSLPSTGEKGKLYVTLDNNNLYRWSGSAWVNVSDGNAHLVIGTTQDTAYRGDHGLAAYTHSQLQGTLDNPHNISKANIGLSSVHNYPVANEIEAEEGTSAARYMTPQRTRQAIEALAPKLAWTVVE